MRGEDSKGLKWSTMRVPMEFKRKFRIMAAEHNMNMSEFARFVSNAEVSRRDFEKSFKRIGKKYKKKKKKKKKKGGLNFKI